MKRLFFLFMLTLPTSASASKKVHVHAQGGIVETFNLNMELPENDVTFYVGCFDGVSMTCAEVKLTGEDEEGAAVTQTVTNTSTLGFAVSNFFKKLDTARTTNCSH